MPLRLFLKMGFQILLMKQLRVLRLLLGLTRQLLLLLQLLRCQHTGFHVMLLKLLISQLRV